MLPPCRMLTTKKPDAMGANESGCSLREPSRSGAGVPPAAGASRPGIRRGRDARADNRDGCPTKPCPGSVFLFCAFCDLLWLNNPMERLPGFRDFYPEPLQHQDVCSADVLNHLFD